MTRVRQGGSARTGRWQAAIMAFRHPDAERVHHALREKNIHVMSHAGRLQIAIHGYDMSNDVERFLDVLHNEL